MVDPVIMTPTHPRWSEFIGRLSRAAVCLHTADHARALLGEMPGIDVEGSLCALRELGGDCDCEIVYGVAETGRRPTP